MKFFGVKLTFIFFDQMSLIRKRTIVLFIGFLEKLDVLKDFVTFESRKTSM